MFCDDMKIVWKKTQRNQKHKQESESQKTNASAVVKYYEYFHNSLYIYLACIFIVNDDVAHHIYVEQYTLYLFLYMHPINILLTKLM